MPNPDATLIEDSIGSGAVCVQCLARLTSLPSSRLNDALPRLIGALRVASTLAACGVCLRQKVVHRCVAQYEPLDESRPRSARKERVWMSRYRPLSYEAG